MPPPGPAQRLWRMRRRHFHIDASLSTGAQAWELTVCRNGRPLFVWRYDDPITARAEAERHRRHLERAGWTSHW